MLGADELVRGDLVTIAGGTGEFAGKPRPAILLQTPRLFGGTVPIPICPVTSVAVEAPLLRIPLPADTTTGLRVPSWAAIDLLHSVRARRIGQHIGRLDAATLLAIDRALVVFLGIAGGPA
jgi:mRNA interferase MazF